MEISFIGVGVMGGGMCRNLLKKGLKVRAIARKKEHLLAFQQAGAAISTRNRDAADRSFWEKRGCWNVWNRGRSWWTAVP